MSSRTSRRLAIACLLALAAAGCLHRDGRAAPAGAAGDRPTDDEPSWTTDELATLRSLSVAALRAPPHDPSNAIADDPHAVALGHRLFFDTRLSRNGELSCASCHDPRRAFTDGRGRARGLGTTRRGAPSLIGAAWAPWLYWDGRRDSLWAQALAPIEAADEMGLSRLAAVRVVADDPALRAPFESLLGPLPALDDGGRFPASAGPFGAGPERRAWRAMRGADRREINRAFAGIGKALAAYQRKLGPGASRFDRYVAGLADPSGAGASPPLDAEELAGLRLFVSPEAQCLRCHNGPLLTNHGFHNVAPPRTTGEPPDLGRLAGIEQVLTDEFNCLGPYSDAPAERCLELRFVKRTGEELPGAFKVPTLRNVARTAPYFHSGQFATLGEVLAHYSQPRPTIGHMEIVPMAFDARQLRALERFLGSLDAGPDTDPALLTRP